MIHKSYFSSVGGHSYLYRILSLLKLPCFLTSTVKYFLTLHSSSLTSDPDLKMCLFQFRLKIKFFREIVSLLCLTTSLLVMYWLVCFFSHVCLDLSYQHPKNGVEHIQNCYYVPFNCQHANISPL